MYKKKSPAAKQQHTHMLAYSTRQIEQENGKKRKKKTEKQSRVDKT
jgi:hypothetical protein